MDVGDLHRVQYLVVQGNVFQQYVSSAAEVVPAFSLYVTVPFSHGQVVTV